MKKIDEKKDYICKFKDEEHKHLLLVDIQCKLWGGGLPEQLPSEKMWQVIRRNSLAQEEMIRLYMAVENGWWAKGSWLMQFEGDDYFGVLDHVTWTQI